jgi:hypothetical protein
MLEAAGQDLGVLREKFRHLFCDFFSGLNPLRGIVVCDGVYGIGSSEKDDSNRGDEKQAEEKQALKHKKSLPYPPNRVSWAGFKPKSAGIHGGYPRREAGRACSGGACERHLLVRILFGILKSSLPRFCFGRF